MAHSLGVVMDPIEDITPYKDTTLALLLEAQRRGYTIHYFTMSDLFVADGVGYGNARTISETKLKNGRTFGEMPLKSITPGVFRRYMDRRSVDAGVQANRELSFIKSAYAWAYERDLVLTNPAAKVRKNKERARDNYVEDAEYFFMRDRATPPVYAAMELAYLCRARISEVLKFDRDMIRDEGLLLERGKGSKTQLIGWTPRLREAIRQGRIGRDGNPKLSRYIVSRNDAKHWSTPWVIDNPYVFVATRSSLARKNSSRTR